MVDLTTSTIGQRFTEVPLGTHRVKSRDDLSAWCVHPWPSYAMLYSTQELLPIIFRQIPDLLLTTHQTHGSLPLLHRALTGHLSLRFR